MRSGARIRSLGLIPRRSLRDSGTRLASSELAGPRILLSSCSFKPCWFALGLRTLHSFLSCVVVILCNLLVSCSVISSESGSFLVPPSKSSPPKPWEREGASGPAPFKPPSGGSTSDAVEASGAAKPGENITATERNVSPNVNGTVSRAMPQRPWQQTGYGNTYGGYGGSNMYSSYGAMGSSYGGGGGLYGNSMYSGYGGGYGGGLYGGTSMYGGGMYGGTGGYGGYGMGGMGGMGMGPYGNPDPNSLGPPASPPGFWMSFLRVMHGVVNFFGRISFLVEQNTQASYFFMTAMLQLFDRSGMLYGELARFVLRLLGIRRKPKKGSVQGPEALAFEGPGQQFMEAPKANSWDNVWGN